MQKGYKLVWSDDFDYTGRPDNEKWSYDTGPKWHNNELQAYTDRPENVYVQDGKLHIRAQQETFMGRCYTSARIHTYGKASWQYGFFEIRGKIPQAVGLWPAFWLMPVSSRNGTPWPLCGEIDMMEHSMLHRDVIVYSLHSQKINHTNTAGPSRSIGIPLPGASGEAHVYGMEWTPDAFVYFYDGRQVCRYDRNGSNDIEVWPFDQPFYLILNIAVGGFMGGPVRDEDFPDEMVLDYVRVYQKG